MPVGAAGTHTVSGVVTYAADSTPAVNAVVWALDDVTTAVHTDATGHYALTLPAATHDVRASTAGCTAPADANVDVSAGDASQDFALTASADVLGYKCTTAPLAFVDGKKSARLGSHAARKIRLPFMFHAQGAAFRNVVVGTYGSATLQPVGATRAKPGRVFTVQMLNAVLTRDMPDSDIVTTTLGAKPNRTFVIEWRDLGSPSSGVEHVTYEAKLYENGNIDMLYKSVPPQLYSYPRMLDYSLGGAPFRFVMGDLGESNPTPLDGVAIHLAGS